MSETADILVVDFGSQYTQLILRRLRGLGVSTLALGCRGYRKEVERIRPRGLILSGSPASVYDPGSPQVDQETFDLGIPVLGICYGMQATVKCLGGSVERSAVREFGRAHVTVTGPDPLFAGLTGRLPVWMSHGDKVVALPEGFEKAASTPSAPFAAMRHRTRPIWGVQFHPEVVHTPGGETILSNFARTICKVERRWAPENQVETIIGEIRERVGSRSRVLMAISGGVDSSVAAALIHRAVGDRLTAIFVDNGLLREGEAEEVPRALQSGLGMAIESAPAGERFLAKLEGVIDPEKKRKIIGHTFIEVFESMAKRFPDAKFLGQGTLYPDVIESTSHRGPSATIKTHHNVGGLPERMQLSLVEPLRYFFKDEVRAVGRALGVPASILDRHPFPGPGLAIRVIGEITRPRLELLRRADRIFVDELVKSGLYAKVWQALAVLLPVSTVGVMGDDRTYESVVVLRAVSSLDGMTADWSRLPARFLDRVSRRITNEVRGINRVVYDVSSKPPATIEWE